jgi:uncharacterized protein YqgV (UPF0045/DUF77 family)
MDTTIPEGFQYIDSTKLSVPVRTTIEEELKNALGTIKEQREKVYNLSVSSEFKQANQDVDELNKDVISKIENKLDSIIETFKLIGGGIFNFFKRTTPKINYDSQLEMLLENLSESISGEKLKFNSLFSSIVLYIKLIRTDKQKAGLVFDMIKTKMATFEVIADEIISIIRQYQKIPSVGGRKRKTRRGKRTNKTNKSAKRRL